MTILLFWSCGVLIGLAGFALENKQLDFGTVTACVLFPPLIIIILIFFICGKVIDSIDLDKIIWSAGDEE